MVTPLSATQTLDRARAALQSGKGAGLPELLKLIEALSTNLEKSSIFEIAELIAQDAAVMSRLLTVANTVSNNPNIAPLSSVEHAIHQVGFQRIRSLAISLMLIENTCGAGNPPEQREAAGLALCAGLFAQGCGELMGSIDPEMAFAAAALRQFGCILLPGVSLEHYREAQQRLKTKPEDIAYRGMFGVTPLEVARKILATSRLPDEIMKALRDTEPEAVGRMPVSVDSRLLGVADMSGRVARLALDPASNREDFEQKTRLLVRKYDRLIPGACEMIEPALIRVDDRIASFNKGAEGSAVPFAIVSRMRSRVQKEAPVAETAPAASTSGGTDAVIPAMPATSSEPETPVPVVATASESTPPTAAPAISEAPASDDAWADALQSSSAFAASADKDNATEAAIDPWATAIAALQESFDARQVWLFLPAAGTDQLALTHGAGGNWNSIQTSAYLGARERTVFGVCITRNETVAVHDTSEASILPYLPAWMKLKGTLPGAFLLIPLGGRGRGIVLIGWRTARRVTATAAQTSVARLLIDSARKSTSPILAESENRLSIKVA